MSEAEESVSQATPVKRRRALRVLGWIGLIFVLVLLVLTLALTIYTKTDNFNRRVSAILVKTLEDATGGRTEVQRVSFNLWRLAAEVDGLVIHGTEGPGEAPYLAADRILLRVTLKDFLLHATGTGAAKYISLNMLQVDRPRVHLIAYKDGTTNQPVPKTQSTSSEPVMDTLLDLQAGKVDLVDGQVLYNNVPVPFNLAANKLGVKVRYIAGADHYGLSLKIDDLRTKMQQMPEAQSHLDLQAELGRKSVSISSLTFDTGKDSHLVISGGLRNFDNPVWELGVKGNVEVPQISVLSGFPGLTSGTVKLDLAGHSCATDPGDAQKDPNFAKKRDSKASKSDLHVLRPSPDCEKGYLLVGHAAWKNAGYVDEYVRVWGVDGKADLKVTPTDLLFGAIAVDLPGGSGSIVGEMRLNNWLGVVPQDAPKNSPTIAAGQQTVNTTAKAVNAKPPAEGDRKLPAVQHAHAYIKVTLNRVTLRTITQVTEAKGYKDLGFDTAVTGPVNVEWGGTTEDIPKTVVVNANLKMAPTGVGNRSGGQNIPINGSVLAEYRGDRNVVNITQLTAQTPATTLEAHGVLGVAAGDPLTNLSLNAEFGDLSEFDSVLNAAGYSSNGKTGSDALPVVLQGQATFQGTARGSLKALNIAGHLEATQIEAKLSDTTDIAVDSIVADADYSPTDLSVASSTIKRGTAVLNVAGKFKPHAVQHGRSVEYVWDKQTEIDAQVKLADANMRDVLDIAGQKDMPVSGTAAVDVHAMGTVGNLSGGGMVSLSNGVAYDQPFDSIMVNLAAKGRDVQVSSLQVKAQGVTLTGNGAYNLDSERFKAHVEGNQIRLSNLEAFKKANLPMDGVLTLRADADGTVQQPGLNAKLTVANMTLSGQPVGQLNADVHSQADKVYLTAQSNALGAQLNVNGNIQLAGDYPMQAQAKFNNVNIAPVLKIYGSSLQGTSQIAGEATVSGPAKQPYALNGSAVVNQFGVTVQGIDLKTAEPIRAHLSNGVAAIDSLHITGPDTDLSAQGSVQVFAADGSALPQQGGKMDLRANGSMGLTILHVLRPDVRSSGKMTLNMTAQGTTHKPSLGGKVVFDKVNIALADIPNGISNLQGTAEFSDDRLKMQDITAESGGGKVKLNGFVQVRGGLFADLTLTADQVRIRYYGVSAVVNANARLQGSGDGAMLSGNVLITRFGLAQTFDFASLGGSSDVSTPPDADSLLNKIRMNVHVQSAPALDFQNSYAKIAGTVDLNVRGTLAVPSILGRITVTDGSATFNGTEYRLQRGLLSFNNPVRIDPTIDVDATARVENYDITIGVHGTSKNFKLTYRSEPPLSQADIFNLLALGRTQEEASINTQQLQQRGQDPTTNAILGGALNATVSNRVNRLFGGAGKIKIDPAYVGTLGQSSARITLEQQLTRQITVVFATNVNTTAQQLIQLQYQLSPDKSIVISRDENGVFSAVYKIRQRYR